MAPKFSDDFTSFMNVQTILYVIGAKKGCSNL